MSLRKKQPVAGTPGPQKPVEVTSERRLTAVEITATVLFFAWMTFMQICSTPTVSLLSIPIMLLLILRKSSIANLQKRASLALVGILGLSVMYGVGLLITPFDKEGLAGFYKFLTGFVLAMIFLCRGEKRHVRAWLWGFMGFNVFHAVVSIEGATANVFYPKLIELFSKAGLDYTSFSAGSMTTRVNGLYNASNVSASLYAIALFVGLYLIDTAASKKERFIAYELTGINAIAFVACVSRGAILFFGIAGIVYLVLQKPDHRLAMFCRVAICVVVTFACQIACALPSITTTFIPMVILLLCGPIIAVLDYPVALVAEKVFSGRKKLIIGSGAAIGAAALVFVVCAMNITRAYTFAGGEWISRSPALKPGTYTVSGDWDGEPILNIGVKDEVGLFIGSELVYRGPLSGAEFEIPEGTRRVDVSITGDSGVCLRNVEFSDGTKLKLGYPLLPESLANRLQGSIFTDSSYVLRKQYMIDALKIFALSPIWGNGLASTEGLYTAVQDVYYMSLFVHNHLIQFMADMGLLGLLSYLMLAVGVLILYHRRLRKEQGNPLAVMLIAVWVMMNGHSLIEFNFSIRCFLNSAFLLYALSIVAMEDEIDARSTVRRSVNHCGALCMAVVLAFTAFFGTSLEIYRIVHRSSAKFETTSYDAFMQQLESYIAWDLYDDTYHKVTYMSNANGEMRYLGKASQYAQELVATKNFTNCDAAAKTFYLYTGNMDGMFNAVKTGLWQKGADKDGWNTELDMLRNEALPILTEKYMDGFLQGLVGLRDYYLTYNEGRLQQIELSEVNLAFLNSGLEAFKADMDGDTAYVYLMTFSDEEPRSADTVE